MCIYHMHFQAAYIADRLMAYVFLASQTNSAGVEVKVLYFSYLTILRKVANHVALLRSTDGTSKKQVYIF